MKNNVFQIICSALAFCLATGCNSYLDVDPKTFFTTETFYSKPEHAQQAVTACCDPLRRPYHGVATYGESPFMMLEFATGVCNTSVGQAAYSAEFREANASEDNLYAWDWWQSFYEGIENCNLAITKLPGTPNVSAADLSHYLGEVHFLRAYYYFMLVQMYGDIPLHTEPTESIEGVNIPRTDKATVYDQIVADLLEAEKSSLPNTSQSGKITKGAVKSMLAKVYFTMAGYPLGKTEMYARAAEKAKKIIDNNWYSLFPTIHDLRDRKKDNTVEHIFQTQYEASIQDHAIHQWLLPRYSGISNYANEYGCFYPDSSFIRTFDPDDERVKEKGFFFTNYPNWNNPEEIVTFTAHIYKFFDDDAMETLQGAQNYSNLRYADLLLVYAEAQNEADGLPNSQALDCYNKVRQRAGLEPSALADFPSQNAFREAVWKERYWELCFENQTWFDMARTRKVLDLKTNRFADFEGYVLPYGNGAFKFTETQFLFPIPLRDRQTNSELTQNPGYQGGGSRRSIMVGRF
ncbi:MAG: RagB/SusD family nutrient uptake outer membrane protein [Tannerellaceae bacterium]|nr:RagB/SusD family nutrient uptake outer membrane protein [Tannerellaceae bacterium]